MPENKAEFLLVFGVIAVLLFLAYWPVVQNFRSTPTDRYYYGANEYPLDMTGDLSYVQQGYHGATLASFNYSTMLGGHPSIVKIEYIAIGLLGRFLHISPIIMFMVSRFVISVGVLLIIYLFIRMVFTDMWERIMGFILAIFGAGITIPGVVSSIGGDAQVIMRLTLSAHHYILGAGAIIFAFYFLSRALEDPKRSRSFLLSLLFGVTASLVYAPDTLIFISGFPLYVVLDTVSRYLKTRRFRIDHSKLAMLFAYASITLGPILYVHYVTSYLWDDIRTGRMEFLLPFHLTGAGYLSGVGIVYLLSFISIPSLVRKGKPVMLLLVTWLAMHPIGEYIVSPVIGLNYYRYFLVPYYVVFGILAVSGLTILAGWMKKHMHAVSRRVILAALVIAVLFSGGSTYISAWQEQHLCFCAGQDFDFGYPKKTVADAIFWLSGNTKPDDIVLSGYFAGTLIPAFAGNRVYVSWWYRLIEPPGLTRTHAKLAAFYGLRMSDEDAEAFVRQEHIAYVFYSEQEQRYFSGGKQLDYPFLLPVYDKGGTIIYSVR